MSNEVDRDLTALDAAIQNLQSLLDIYPEDAEYKLITNDFQSFSNTFKSKNEVSDFLTELTYSSSSRGYEEVFDRISQELTSEVKDVFWVGDFTQGILPQDPITFDSTRNLNLIPLFFNSIENVHVDSIYLNSPFLFGDSRPKLTAVLSNTGLIEVNDLVVKVILDEVEVATGSIDILPNDRAEVSFDLTLDLKSVNKGRITLEDFPVTFDNEFYFTLSTTRKVNVLEVKQESAVSPVEVVYGNRDVFEFQSFESDNLDYSQIEKSDLIVLNGLDAIESSLVLPLNSYVDNGGTILLVPDYRPDISSYRQLRGLGRLDLVDTTSRVGLATPDYNNPFFENVFEENSSSIAMPKVTNTLSLGGGRSAILATQAGLAYLSEIKSVGSIYVLGSPMKPEFGTFQDHALFVPVMYRLAISGAKNEQRLYNYIDTETVTYGVETEQAENLVKLKNEEEELIPSYRFGANGLLMQVPKFLLDAGFYDLEINNSKQGALAFNYSPYESDLRQEQQLSNYFQGNVEIFDGSNNEKFASQVRDKYVGVPLWKYAVILALLFLLCEVLLIRFLP